MRSLITALLLSALPSSPNPISAGNVQTEFARGGANPISFSEYYKGGLYVFTGDTAPNVPTSGTISLGNFHGAARSTALAASKSGDAYGMCDTSSPCTATSNAVTITPSGGTPPYSYAWTYVSGTSFTGTGTNPRSWSKSNVSPASLTAVYRCTVTDAVLATATVDVNVALDYQF